MIKYINKIVYFLGSVFLMANCNSGQSGSQISMGDFKELMQQDSSITILDVRTPGELSGPLGHIDGVINIPVQELNSRLSELDSYKDKKLYVICRTGNRSGAATKILNSKGFNAVNVLGGMTAYRN